MEPASQQKYETGRTGPLLQNCSWGAERPLPVPPLQHRALSGQVQGLFPSAEHQCADAEQQMSLSTSPGVTATGTAGDPGSATTFGPSSSTEQEHQPSRAVSCVTQAGVTLVAIPPPGAVVSISAARLLISTARHTLGVP